MQVVDSSKLSVQALANNEQVYKGILHCFSKTYKEAGIRGLYRGVGMDSKLFTSRVLTLHVFVTCWPPSVLSHEHNFSAPSLYGIFPYAGLKFYFYEEMKRHVPDEHKKNIMVKLVCGSVAGLLGQTFTYPLDVVRRQMQVMNVLPSSISLEFKFQYLILW